MKFSCILTSFRRPHLVRQAIRSVLDQSFPCELIVVDDNSGPETWEAIAGELRPSVDLLMRTHVTEEDRPKSCRYAVCINKGLIAAGGDVITYLTDDDRYLPGRLERMARLLENPAVMCVYEDQVIARIEGNNEVQYGRRGTHGVTRELACRVDHSSFAHRRECLDAIDKPWWPEEAQWWGMGDAGFFQKLTRHFDFHPIAEPGSVHRWHENSVQTRMMAGKGPVYSEEL